MNDRIREWNQLDGAVHEPARLAILYSAGEAGFVYLQREGGFTQGKPFRPSAETRSRGCVQIQKKFKGKLPSPSASSRPRASRRSRIIRNRC